MSEKPLYYEDNFATKFLTGQDVFPPDRRIFHRPEYTYDLAAALTGAVFDGSQVVLDLEYQSGSQAKIWVTAAATGALRMRIGAADALFDLESAMLVPQLAPAPELGFTDLGDGYEIQFMGYRLHFDRQPFCLKIYAPSGEIIFESETEKIVDMYTAPPLGLRRKDGSSWAFLSWRNRNQDRYYGLGEKFTRFEKTSSRATIWSADTCGSNTTDMAYKAVPVLYSTAGWGLMLHSGFRSYWEIGSFSYATSSLMVEDSKLDCFLMLNPSLAGLVETYTNLTGKPSLPPKWAFGAWMSRAAYTDKNQMLEAAHHLRQEGIGCDVFHIDPTWMQDPFPEGYYNTLGVMVCHFDFNTRDWGEPEALFADFKALGCQICLWLNPYFHEGSALYAEAKDKGYLVRSRDGGISRLEFNLKAGIVDFTNPAAKAWWQGFLIDLLQKGAAVFKVDFGDRVPEDAVFFNGRSGAEMHNIFVNLYAEAVYEAVRQVKGTGLVWRRPGYIGSQRFSGCWAGDTQVSWEGMQGALRGGLSAAFTGDAFWSHDIGGFVGPKPSEELYIRWMQFGLFSPLARYHGTTPREPWHYGEQAVQLTRRYTRLRYSLIPYLLAYGYLSSQTGLPLLRPMPLEFPAEPKVEALDDQYLLGSDILVAPVMILGAAERFVYFPAGEWRRLEDPLQVVQGPGYRRVPAPLEDMPVYVRSGAVLPRYAHPPQHLQGSPEKEWRIEIYPGDSERHLHIPEDGFPEDGFPENGFDVKLDYTCRDGNFKLMISPAPLQVTLQWIGVSPNQLPASQPWQEHPLGACLTINAAQGFSLSSTQ